MYARPPSSEPPDEEGFYLYTSTGPSSPLHSGNVFYRAANEQSARALCRLFQKEYPLETEGPYFSALSANEIEVDEQVLLDEALSWLDLYDDPDPGIYDPPPTAVMMRLAQYARRASSWESLIASREGSGKKHSITNSQEAQNAKETIKPESGATVKTAFISYSWDDDGHCEWVRQLATRLRADGVDVSIDRWAAVPGDQLPAFMERAIRENQFVVIVCTPRYKRRSDAREGGVGYEGDIMTAEAMTSQNQRKFIPILRGGEWKQAAPSWLLGKYYINLTGDPYLERDYEDLVRTLLGIRETAPPIGKPMATIARSNQAREVPQGNSKGESDDIKITRVIVEDITQPRHDGTPGSALYSIPFALSRRPSSEWAGQFIENWNHPPQWTTRHRPGIATISGSTITLNGTTIEEVEQYHRDTLQLAVNETNRQYREWRSEQDQRLAREQALRDSHRKRVEDVSKKITFD
jgi:hypothetical protein